MKTKAILGLLVAGAMSFTACTNKVDEKTISEINQFGTEWSALGERANSWGNELSQTTAKAKEFAVQQTTLANNMATTKDESMKAKVNEMAGKASQDASNFEAMENEWNTFKSTWDETTKQFTEWKDKVMKGEVTPEEASKGIEDYKAKLAEAQAKVDTWTAQYAEVKSSCEQNMAMAQSMNMPAEKK